MRLVIAACLVALAVPISVRADPPHMPFDMSSERNALPPENEQRKEESRMPAASVSDERETSKALRIRYLLPAKEMQFSGESSVQSWSIFLTAAEAGAARGLNYGYINAIYAAPESSTLSIAINGTIVAEEPIRSAAALIARRVPLTAGLLKPGANNIRIGVVQRHRTDCTIEATYDLWTKFTADKAFLDFDPGAKLEAKTIEDVKAVGFDKEGRTRFHILLPTQIDLVQANISMKLAQELALIVGLPNQSFTVDTERHGETGPGRLDVVVGPASEIGDVLPAVPDDAKKESYAGFVRRPSGEMVLLLSGPDWNAVSAALDNLLKPFGRGQDDRVPRLGVEGWTGRDVPLLFGNARLSFSRLGIETSEFSGRRFRVSFDIGLPADFYGNAYDHVLLLLDAAYSRRVLPGSRIDVYVNQNIAATMPILSAKGGIIRHQPLAVTMRHFRPGKNHIEIEAVVQTTDDRACVPGAQQGAEPDVALFSSSEIVVPTFARIATLPNLAATAGTGFPYDEMNNTPLVLAGLDSPLLSTAATFLGKLALTAGRPIGIAVETGMAPASDNAIFVGTIAHVPGVAMQSVHLDGQSTTEWRGDGATQSANADDRAGVETWKRRVRANTWRGGVDSLRRWIEDTFDISPASLQFLPAEEVDMIPANAASFLIAQGIAPSGKGAWTVLAAPTIDDLRSGMMAMADAIRWEAIAGRLAFYEKVGDKVAFVAPSKTMLLQTQPFSLANYRLIATNWLSTNTLVYVALIASSAILLGVATLLMLNNFGRRS